MKYPEIKETVRKLRNHPTAAEVKLWGYLRNRQLDGRKFLRQHALFYESIRNEHFFYVPDFYCAAEKLVVELDGKIHDSTKERDAKRDKIIESKGIKVIRIKNEQLNKMENVLKIIRSFFTHF